MAFRVTFWGVRGSIACPTPDRMVYGGNTSCLEVQAGEARLVLDAGTGARGLGKHLLEDGVRRIRLLFSHTHWDHINGFPFFGPAQHPKCEIEVMAGHLAHNGGIERVLAGQMAKPWFPVPMDQLAARLSFGDFRAGDRFSIGEGLRIGTAPLCHPDGATGYRIEYAGKALCYVTDTEHVPGQLDDNVLALIEGADLVVYDCSYTDDTFVDHVGWGHSTWQQGVRLCRAAQARRLAIFHHDPDHDDRAMARIEAQARQMWSGAVVAREGMSLELIR